VTTALCIRQNLVHLSSVKLGKTKKQKNSKFFKSGKAPTSQRSPVLAAFYIEDHSFNLLLRHKQVCLGVFLMDEVNLRPGKRAKKLRT
jgi:hypothetical protein